MIEGLPARARRIVLRADVSTTVTSGGDQDRSVSTPSVITAGTFHQDGEKIFWDVHDPRKVLVIELHDETYVRLVIEVEDPRATARLVQTAISGP